MSRARPGLAIVVTCVMLTLVVPTASASVALSAPEVTVSPDETEVADPIRVSATGFTPAAVVDVFLDQADVATATVTDGGTVKARIAADHVQEPGQRWITVLERGSARSAQTTAIVGPLLAPRWTTPIRDVREGESIFWTDVHGEYAYPIAIEGSTAIVAWNGSVLGTDGAETGRNRLVGLDISSGRASWAHEDDLAMGTIATNEGWIVDAGRGGRSVVGIRADDGTIGWRRSYATGGFVDLLTTGDVVVGLAHHRTSVEAADPRTGASAWSLDLDVRSTSSASRVLVSDGEMLWVAVGQEWGPWGLRRVDPDTGTIVASISPPPSARSLLAATADEVYVAGWSVDRWSSDLALAALEPEGGDARWVRPVMPKDCRSETESCIPRGMQVVPAGDLVVVRTYVERIPDEPCAMGCPFGRDLWAIDAATGSLVWHVTLEDDWEGGPGLAVADGVLYATDDALVTRSLQDGSVIATKDAPDRPAGQEVGPRRYSSGLLAAEGTLIVGTWSGTIMAMETIAVSARPDPATLVVSDLPSTVEPTPPAVPTPAPPAGTTGWARAGKIALIGVAGGLLLAIGLALLVRRRHPRGHAEPSPR